jgi:hypothetical protein
VLENAGLVSRGREAQFRPAQLDARPLAAASGWIGDYARFWADSLGSLDQYLNALQQLDITDTTPRTPEQENNHD